MLKTNYYKSNLQTYEDWHAGAKIIERYYSYLKLYPDGKWISTNWYPDYVDGKELDFIEFLESLDIGYLFSSNHCPPTSADRDHNFMYHRGTYEVKGDSLQLTCSFKQIGATSDDDLVNFNWEYKITNDGNVLIDSEGNEYLHNNH